jgi:thiol-disulfide isomerase/thioredoxin
MKQKVYVVFSSILAVIFTVWRISAQRQGIGEPQTDVGVGDTLCRADHRSWASPGSSALVIVGASYCPACQAAQPFEEQLNQYGENHDIPVFYVFSQDARNDALAIQLRQAKRTVIRANLRVLGVRRTPSFLRVDDQGIVQSMWTNSIPPGTESEVLAGLATGHLETYDKVSAAELAAYLTDSNYRILALSEIGHDLAPRASVIPFSELGVRAKYELNPEQRIVLDCGTALSPLACQQAAIVLSQMRFKQVIAVGLPPRRPGC